MTITCTKDSCQLKAKATTLDMRFEATADGSRYTINQMELPGPGEYEIGEIFAEITPALAHFHFEDMVCVVRLGDDAAMTSADFEQLEQVDMFLIISKSNEWPDLEAALKISAKLEPKVIILAGIDSPELMAKLEGRSPQVVDTVKLAAKDLPEDGQQLYIVQSR